MKLNKTQRRQIYMLACIIAGRIGAKRKIQGVFIEHLRWFKHDDGVLRLADKWTIRPSDKITENDLLSDDYIGAYSYDSKTLVRDIERDLLARVVA